MFVPHSLGCSSSWYDFLMVPIPQVVGVHWDDDASHFFVDYVLGSNYLDFPFDGDDAADAEVMVEVEAVEEEAVEEEGSVAVVVVAAEAPHGSLVVVVRYSLVRYSLAGWCHHRRGCRMSLSTWVS